MLSLIGGTILFTVLGLALGFLFIFWRDKPYRDYMKEKEARHQEWLRNPPPPSQLMRASQDFVRAALEVCEEKKGG